MSRNDSQPGGAASTGDLSNRHFQSTIMIVDDEPINIDVVQAFLEDEGYVNFVTVQDSRKALQSIEETRPDLLLLDLIMPEVSGFDILAEVRRHPRFCHLPVIILTASTDNQSRLRALSLGATDFLAKPLDHSELGLRVRNTLFAKAYQDQLAYYDPLTKLPNRQLFMEDFNWALKGAKRHTEPLALLTIEIDNFNQISDTLGWSAGDEVLLLVTQRILGVIRNADLLCRNLDCEDAGMTLFHMDGCVFSLLLDRMKGADCAAGVSQRIIEEIRAPLQVEGRELYVTASVGIAGFPADGDESSTLLRLASSAKDFARKKGGNIFQFTSNSINEMYEKRLRLETRLRKAIEKQEFVLHYQPKVEIETGRVVGVEALLRWFSDEGLVMPGEFIPMAEETGMIIPIGKWCLVEACRQLSEWHRSGKTLINLSVNLSARQFADASFMEEVEKIVTDSGIDTSYLTLELTESLLIEDFEQKIQTLHKLKALGLKLSIDDFGTGYSSLSYLVKLPVDELKIDRSFIMELGDSSSSRAIVSTIIFMAKSLNLKTVAEGIEEKEELAFLQSHCCDQYQGFIFSRAVPPDKIFELLT